MANDPELEAIRARLRKELEQRPRAASPVGLEAASFDAWVAAQGLAMVDVWAPWCGPCRTMEPIVDELSRAWAGRIAVGKLNADEAPAIVERYRISGIPQFLFFQRGRSVGRLVGARPKRDFHDVAADLFAPSTSPL